MGYEEVELSRECDAIQIPHGTVVILPEGTPVVITQALGDSYTVQAPTLGGLFRVAEQDADALGKRRKSVPTQGQQATAPTAVTGAHIWEALREVYDPELPINIVDLGLIYDLCLAPLPNGATRVAVRMTLTAPGCGMGPAIARDVQNRLERLAGVGEADVEVVWEPPWHPDRISPEGKKHLGLP